LQNFAIRKHTLDYDDVMNVQRKWIYERRLAALDRPSIKDEVTELIDSVLDGLIDQHCPEKEYPENWNLTLLSEELRTVYLFDLRLKDEEIPALTRESLREKIHGAVSSFYNQKEAAYGVDIMRQLERYAVLSTIDRHWRDHLSEIEELRTGIGLRAYHGQIGKPIDIYKREAFGMFEKMLLAVDREIVNLVYKLQVKVPDQMRAAQRTPAMVASHQEATNLGYGAAGAPSPPAGPTGEGESNPMAAASQAGTRAATVRRTVPKVPANAPCPCGSGKKYKKCHGARG
jgi:preprotein translocase subunit SecA